MSRIIYLLSLFSLSVLLIIPIWRLDFLPLVDLPNHAAQIQIILNYETYSDRYKINFFTPYLLGYGLVIIIAQIFSLITSIKIVLSLSLLAIPLASAWLLKELGANRYAIWSVFPVAFSYSFYWGFLNYIVATPITILFFVFLTKYAKAKINSKWIAEGGCFSLLVFFSHALSWVFAMIIGAAIIHRKNSIADTLKKFSILLLPSPIVFLWLLFTDQLNQSLHVNSFSIEAPLKALITNNLSHVLDSLISRVNDGSIILKFKEALSFSIGLSATWTNATLALLLLSWPLWLGARIRKNYKHWLPMLFVFFIFMITPYWLLNTAYVYMRSAVFLIPASFFLFAWFKHIRTTDESLRDLRSIIIHGSAFAIITAVMFSHIANFNSFLVKESDFKEILALMEPDKRVLYLQLNSEIHIEFASPYLHYGSWYLAAKGGEVPGFAHDPDAKNVPVKYRRNPWHIPSSWDAGKFDWKQHRGDRYHYFIILSESKLGDFVKKFQGNTELIAQRGAWHLYRNKWPMNF